MCCSYMLFDGTGIREVVYKTTRKGGGCMTIVGIRGSDRSSWCLDMLCIAVIC